MSHHLDIIAVHSRKLEYYGTTSSEIMSPQTGDDDTVLYRYQE